MKRNRMTFGLGTIGRDMVYSLVSMYLIFYLTEVLRISSGALAGVTAILVAARIFDAVNDPVMGVIVDNTKTKYGKYKPWIVIGAILSGIFTILLFTDFGFTGSTYVLMFGIIYIFWGIAFTINDISYWSMLPALSIDQKERERIGAFARICANIGLFVMVAGIVPITEALEGVLGSMKEAYFVLSIGVVVLLLLFQAITVFGVKEPKIETKQQSITLKDIFKVIFKNDQLLYVVIAMALFMIGYVTTTSFGLYFFKYAYGDESVYSLFAVILGVSQILALALFPVFSKRFNRKVLYTAATSLVVAGYILFFFSPMNMLFIGTAGILMFAGQAFIQLLMLMFLADTIEYGQWKLGTRNTSVTFSLQPFINKIGGAMASGIVGITLIISGINEAESIEDVSNSGLTIMKVSMLLLPLVFILVGYFIYRAKYKINEEMFSKIVEDLKERGDIQEDIEL